MIDGVYMFMSKKSSIVLALYLLGSFDMESALLHQHRSIGQFGDSS